MCFSKSFYITVEWEGTICTEENSLFPLVVQSFVIHLGKVTFTSEYYSRSGLNCACFFKWHTKEEHNLWDWLWLRSICPFPKQSTVPLLPCHCPSPPLSNNFLLNTEGKTADKKESIPLWGYRGTFKKQEIVLEDWTLCLFVCLFTFSMIKSWWRSQVWFSWGQPSLNTKTLAGEEK